MAEQTLDSLLKQVPLHVEVAQLIKEVRMNKKVSQGDICKGVGMSRQHLSNIENGRLKRVDLEELAAIFGLCGERLFITSSYDNPLQVSDQTEQEDQVLNAYAAGELEKAESLLMAIRRWHYPTEHINAKCKRNTAVAISYHFKGLCHQSQNLMNQLVMGLGLLSCGKEADYFIEIYQRIIEQGEKALMEKRYRSQKGGSS